MRCSPIISQPCKKLSVAKRCEDKEKLYFWPFYGAGLSHILVMSGNHRAISRPCGPTVAAVTDF